MQEPLNLNEAIYNIQKYLRAISFADSRVTRPPLDGLFDTDTRQAVIDFQRTRSLPPSGVVDKATHDAIFEEYLLLNEKNERPMTPSFFPENPQDYEATLGEEHPFIAIVQIMLKELSVVYDGFDKVAVSGIFDGATEEAVRIFQKASLLPVTGRVDLNTYNRLNRDFFNYSRF